MDNLNLFIPIKKVDAAQRLVYGTLAAEMADQSGEILDYDTAKAAFQTWSDEFSKKTEGKSKGNVRAMHGNVAAGKLTDISFDDAAKTISGVAYISDDQEWRKCQDGTYTGFSLGGKYAKRWTDSKDASLKRYTPTIAEVSVVDNPCIPSATFEFIKADGGMEMRKFAVAEEAEKDAAAGVEQVWLAKDGTTHKKKADAVQKNVEIAKAVVPDAVKAAMDALKTVQDALTAKEGGAEAGEVAKAPDAGEGDAAKAAAAEQPADDNGAGEDAAKTARAAMIKIASENLAKGLYDVANLIDVINAMQWLTSDLNWNALFTDSESTLPQDCKAVLAQLCELLTAMVAEATASITADKASALTAAHVEALRKFSGNPDALKDWMPPVEKAAAVDPEALEKIRTDHADELKKISDAFEAEKLAKATLEKAVTDLTSGIGDMAKRIEKLEAQPAPVKGVKSVTVIKGHEGEVSGTTKLPDEVLIAKFAHLPPEQARAKLQEARAAQA